MKRQNKTSLIVKLAVLAAIVIYALVISANPSRSNFASLVSEALGFISSTGSFAMVAKPLNFIRGNECDY